MHQSQFEYFTEYIPMEKTYIDYEVVTRTIQVPMTYEIIEYVPQQQLVTSQITYQYQYPQQYPQQQQQQSYRSQDQYEQQASLQSSRNSQNYGNQLQQSNIHYNSERYRPGLQLENGKKQKKGGQFFEQKSKRSRIFD